MRLQVQQAQAQHGIVRVSVDYTPDPTIPNAHDLPTMAQYLLATEPQDGREHIRAVYLGAQMTPLAPPYTLAIGLRHRCEMGIPELLRPAIVMGAISIVITHNHPGGSPRPSPEDVDLTMNTLKACNMLQFNLVDHIVTAGAGGYYSFHREGMI